MKVPTQAKYRSSIPPDAQERVIETYESGAKRQSDFFLDAELVGRRYYFETGELEDETPFRNGRMHGVEYRWHEPGVLLSTERWVDGLPHGTAKQWLDGKLVGTYEMVRGTGIDLWWGKRFEDDAVVLAEARYLVNGQRHGFEWWIDQDQKSVHEESHFWHGEPHGIERQWNSEGRLRRGFPKYFVGGKKVAKRQYTAACKKDPTLPLYRAADDRPVRRFPPEIRLHLGPVQRRRR